MQINSHRELISCFVKKQDKPDSQNNFEDEMFRKKELVGSFEFEDLRRKIFLRDNFSLVILKVMSERISR